MEVRKGTFEWSIQRFLKRQGELKKSRKFKFWGEDCYLQVPGRDGSCCVCSFYYPFYLMGISDGRCYNTVIELCLIDNYREDFFVTKRTAFNILSEQLLLMAMHDQELRGNWYELLPGGTLTVRLSWYEKQDDAVREQNTQTTPDLITDQDCISGIENACLKCEEKGSMMMLETLSRDLSCFYESKADTDCVLKVGDAKFPVHRAVLSARSEVFAAMFRHDTSEACSGFVNITDVEADVLSDVLHYVYSGKVLELTPSTAVSLYVVADKYALIELKHFCLNFLMQTITIGNVCDAAALAHTYGEEELEKKVVQFIRDRMEEVQESVEWKRFSSSKPSLVIKLLCSTVMACKDKSNEESLK